MALIEGFEYDIFISYRQNDNKYDGWVTDFVLNLRKELQATFKEEVNVYFDENPHDGLLETHHVSDSLKHKIKSLIFIPIISQTYCDPKSFAWKNEFLVFKSIASEDRFGLNIKLISSGNVTSRIVPVRIHDLDSEDKALIETSLGGPIRTINFIYKAPGVNRPLRASEDRPHDNQDKTYYRDQINKVANLSKDIISSLIKSTKNEVHPGSPKSQGTELAPGKSNIRKIAIASIVGLTILLVAYYFSLNRFNKEPSSINNVSIAVLPFKVIGKEEESQYFADGVMEVILSNLTIFPELKVKPASSVERYRDSKKSISEIAYALGVQYILEGSAQKLGDDIRIVVRLIDAHNDSNVWSETFIKKFSNVFDIQNQISATIAQSLKAKLTPDIRVKISRRPTSDFEAYDLFLRARQLSKRYELTRNKDDLDLSVHLLKQAITKDDQFALGYAWLSGLKAIEISDNVAARETLDTVLLLANEALKQDSSLVEASLVLSQVYDYLQDNVKGLRYTYKALDGKLSDTTYSANLIKRLAALYSRIGDVEKSIYLYDRMLKMSPNQEEVIRLKFIPLAASGKSAELIELEDEVNRVWPNSSFHNLIKTHMLAERKDYEGLVTLYGTWSISMDDLDLLDQYVFIYAYALKKASKEREAMELVSRFKNLIATDNNYLQAQVLLFKGHSEEALQLLKTVQIGWYNLSVCNFNPLLDPIRNDVQFQRFVNWNAERMMDERARVGQLESNGFLPVPQEYFAIPEFRD